MLTKPYMKPSMVILDLEAEQSMLNTSGNPGLKEEEIDEFD